MKCGTCGVESDWDKAFRQTRRSFSFREIAPMCPACWKRDQENITKWAIRVLLALSILLIVVSMTVAKPEERFHLLALPLIPFFFPLAIVVHEFAHALAALALGLRVFSVSYGLSGPLLFRGRIRNWAFEIRRSPPSGFTQAAPRTTKWLRLRWGLFVAAAPMTNALLAVGLFAYSTTSSIVGAFATSFAWANLIALFSSLFPWKYQTRFGATPSDGLILLKLPFEKAESDRRKQAAYFALEGTECLRRKDYARAAEWAQFGQQNNPGEIQTRCVLGLALLGLKRFDEAREHFLEMAASDDPLGKAPPHRAIFLNNLAWTDLMAGGAERLDEADRYSYQAMRLTPWVAAIKGTRGSILVALGQIDEGVTLLHEAIDEHEENANKALNACFLAIGFHKAGNSAASRRSIEKARQLDPNCELIPWAVEKSTAPMTSESDRPDPAATPEACADLAGR